MSERDRLLNRVYKTSLRTRGRGSKSRGVSKKSKILKENVAHDHPYDQACTLPDPSQFQENIGLQTPEYNTLNSQTSTKIQMSSLTDESQSFQENIGSQTLNALNDPKPTQIQLSPLTEESPTAGNEWHALALKMGISESIKTVTVNQSTDFFSLPPPVAMTKYQIPEIRGQLPVDCSSNGNIKISRQSFKLKNNFEAANHPTHLQAHQDKEQQQQQEQQLQKQQDLQQQLNLLQHQQQLLLQENQDQIQFLQQMLYQQPQQQQQKQKMEQQLLYQQLQQQKQDMPEKLPHQQPHQQEQDMQQQKQVMQHKLLHQHPQLQQQKQDVEQQLLHQQLQQQKQDKPQKLPDQQPHQQKQVMQHKLLHQDPQLQQQKQDVEQQLLYKQPQLLQQQKQDVKQQIFHEQPQLQKQDQQQLQQKSKLSVNNDVSGYSDYQLPNNLSKNYTIHHHAPRALEDQFIQNSTTVNDLPRDTGHQTSNIGQKLPSDLSTHVEHFQPFDNEHQLNWPLLKSNQQSAYQQNLLLEEQPNKIRPHLLPLFGLTRPSTCPSRSSYDKNIHSLPLFPMHCTDPCCIPKNIELNTPHSYMGQYAKQFQMSLSNSNYDYQPSTHRQSHPVKSQYNVPIQCQQSTFSNNNLTFGTGNFLGNSTLFDKTTFSNNYQTFGSVDVHKNSTSYNKKYRKILCKPPAQCNEGQQQRSVLNYQQLSNVQQPVGSVLKNPYLLPLQYVQQPIGSLNNRSRSTYTVHADLEQLHCQHHNEKHNWLSASQATPTNHTQPAGYLTNNQLWTGEKQVHGSPNSAKNGHLPNLMNTDINPHVLNSKSHTSTSAGSLQSALGSVTNKQTSAMNISGESQLPVNPKSFNLSDQKPQGLQPALNGTILNSCSIASTKNPVSLSTLPPLPTLTKCTQNSVLLRASSKPDIFKLSSGSSDESRDFYDFSTEHHPKKLKLDVPLNNIGDEISNIGDEKSFSASYELNYPPEVLKHKKTSNIEHSDFFDNISTALNSPSTRVDLSKLRQQENQLKPSHTKENSVNITSTTLAAPSASSAFQSEQSRFDYPDDDGDDKRPSSAHNGLLSSDAGRATSSVAASDSTFFRFSSGCSTTLLTTTPTFTTAESTNISSEPKNTDDIQRINLHTPYSPAELLICEQEDSDNPYGEVSMEQLGIYRKL